MIKQDDNSYRKRSQSASGIVTIEAIVVTSDELAA
jgi:hypothetical protein